MKKIHIILGAVFLAVFAIAMFVVASKQTIAASAISRPAACAPGTACTTGTTCCWTTVEGGHEATCVGGKWSSEHVNCGKKTYCSSEGIGGVCQQINNAAQPMKIAE